MMRIADRDRIFEDGRRKGARQAWQAEQWRAGYVDAMDRIAAARAICLDVETGAVPSAAASEAYGLATDVLHALRSNYVTDADMDGYDGE